MLDEALDAFLDRLDAYTLADLVEPKRAARMAAILKIRLH
jgi:DNA-binding IscR family transcriptional regulator